MLKVFLLLLLGTLPAAYALVASRKLYRKVDDPLFPDLILAHFRKVSAVAGVALGAGAVLFRTRVVEIGVLVFVSVLAGRFPIRKKMYRESWTLFAYLSHRLRFWVGALGSLVLIAFIPAGMSMAGDRSVLAGSLLAAAAVLWAYFGSTLFLRLVLARPLESVDLREAFAPVLAEAKCAGPALFQADAPGGTWVNAFALPSIRGSSVLFTRGLVDALTPPESAAIFAHEIAHLEHHTPRKLVTSLALTFVLATAPVVLWNDGFGGSVRAWAWLWPLVILAALLARTIGHRAHEAESDRRAVELSGDPEALVSALTKIHALNRVSRRWSEAQERLSSHPSLARRIQTIRAPGSKPTSTPSEGTKPVARLFRAADSSHCAVFFDDARLHWLQGVPADGRDVLARSNERRSIAYGELSALHLVGTLRERRLVFTDASRRTYRMPISAEDVPELDALLDRVDDRLGYAPARRGAPLGRLWSLLLLVFGFLPSLWSLTLLGALALVRPIEATLTALGAGALTAAAWRFLRPAGLWTAALPSWCLVVVGGAGAASLVAARKARRRGSEQTSRELLLAVLVPLGLALAGSLGAALAPFSALPWMLLHLWARESLTVVNGLLASAAALATWPRARARVGSAALVVLAAGIILVGSLEFRERASGDVFRSMGRPLLVRGASLRKVREVEVRATVSELRLSPRGTRFAVATVSPGAGERYRSSGATEFLASGDDGSLSPIRALALDFLDEDRLAVLEEDRGRMVLKVVPLSNPSSEVLVHDMPLLAGPRLWTSADSHTWRVLGRAWEDDELIALGGRLDSDEIDERRYPLEGGDGSLVNVSSEGFALGTFYELFQNDRWGRASAFLYAFTLSSGSHSVVDLRVSRPGETPRSVGKTALLPTCFPGPTGEARFFCSASDGERTGIWSFDPTSGSWKPLGFLSGYFYARESPSLEKGRLVLSGWNAAPVLVELNRGTVLLPSREGKRGRSRDWGIVAWNGDRLASARRKGRGDETTVSFYTLHP